MIEKNYYDTLGVHKNATEAEIKHAFRKLVRKYHPDVNDAPDADDKVAELNVAYETLSDEVERAKYDALQSTFGRGADSFKQSFKEGFGKFNDGKNTEKEAFDKATSETYWEDLNTNVQKNWEEIKEKFGENAPFGSGSFDFEDLVNQFKRNSEDDGFNNGSSTNRESANSSNQQDSRQSTDNFKNFDKFADLFGDSGTHDTSGSRKFRESTQSDGFSQSSQGNDSVKGADQQVDISVDLDSTYTGDNYNIKLNVPVSEPDGSISHETKSLKVRIPKGIIEGKKIRLSEKGSASLVGGKNGDLFLNVVIKHDEHIRLEEADVYQTVNITPWEAVLGADILVKTPAGEFEVTIPPNSKSDNTLRLSKKGIPAEKCGDLYVVLNIINPNVQNSKERLAYEELRDAFKDVEIER